MAERRMLSKKIIDSDAFLDLPLSTQSLYFHLSMRADDEGFINNQKRIMRMIGANEDELKLLIAKGFLIMFESGVIVIKHWRVHNYIQKDRFKNTSYTFERSLLSLKDNNAYTLDTECIQDVPVGKVRLGEISLVKDSIDEIKKPFSFKLTKSTQYDNLSEAYKARLQIYAQQFENGKSLLDAMTDHHTSNGKGFKDWSAAFRTWERNDKKFNNTSSKKGNTTHDLVDEYFASKKDNSDMEVIDVESN